MHYGKIFIACSFVLTGVTSLPAQTPIKSVDQSGNVTYSDKPTVDAASSTEMQIDAGPTESQIEEAKERSKKTIDSAEKAQAERDALAAEREAERQKAAEDRAAQKPEVIIIKDEGYYPAYNPPLGARPPIARPLPSPR